MNEGTDLNIQFVAKEHPNCSWLMLKLHWLIQIRDKSNQWSANINPLIIID